jgi:Zn-dependent protease/CBS domain-containing protein
MAGSGFRIGRIFGIDIRIDWSWFFIFLLVTWNLSLVFGSMHPDWNIGLRWGLSLAASLLFFLSVLAHELAHSLMARAQGVPVRSITLFLFGGVSNIQRHPPSPQAEFLISIVGPATSILLGLLFVFLAGNRVGQFLEPGTSPQALIAQLDPLNTLLLWLGPVNIILGLFNLIPGFPLDGGRILRSILWVITDNLRRATRWASWIGQGVAWLMIATGIAMAFGLQVPFFGTGLASGLWLAFIGWFLNSASVQSYQQVLVQDILEGVPVGQMMRSDAPVVSPDRTVSDLVHDHVMRTDEHAFPVIQDDRLVGIVTLEDVRRIDRSEWETVKVADIMTPRERLQVVTSRDDASDALNKMMQRDVRQLPVVQDGRLVGLLRRRDIVRWMQLQSELGELR